MTHHKNKAQLASILAALFGLSACGTTASNDPSHCAGDTIEVNGQTYCVANRMIQETGFECPRNAPFAAQFGELRVCGPGAELPPPLTDRLYDDYPADQLPDPCHPDTCHPSACGQPQGCQTAPPMPPTPTCTPDPAGEVCGDGQDNDCDDRIDCDDPDCAGEVACAPPAPTCEDDDTEDDDTQATAAPLPHDPDVNSPPLDPRTLCPGDDDWRALPVTTNPNGETHTITVQTGALAPGDLVIEWRAEQNGQSKLFAPVEYSLTPERFFMVQTRPGERVFMRLHNTTPDEMSYRTFRESKLICACSATTSTDACQVAPAGWCDTCKTDTHEPNDAVDQAATLPARSAPNNAHERPLSVCPGDDDWFIIPAAASDAQREVYLSGFQDGRLGVEWFIMKDGQRVPIRPTMQPVDTNVSGGVRAVRYLLNTIAGSSYAVRLFSADGNPHDYNINLPGATSCASDTFEPNDTITIAADLPVSALDTITHNTVCANDTDWFKLTGANTPMQAGDQLTVHLDLAYGASMTELQLVRVDAQGQQHIISPNPFLDAFPMHEGLGVYTLLAQHTLQPGEEGDLFIKMRGASEAFTASLRAAILPASRALTCDDGNEPNNRAQEAKLFSTVSVGITPTAYGTLCGHDEDWIAFPVQAGEIERIQVTSELLGVQDSEGVITIISDRDNTMTPIVEEITATRSPIIDLPMRDTFQVYLLRLSRHNYDAPMFKYGVKHLNAD